MAKREFLHEVSPQYSNVNVRAVLFLQLPHLHSIRQHTSAYVRNISIATRVRVSSATPAVAEQLAALDARAGSARATLYCLYSE
jgi:hypothetical protein